MPMLEVPNVEWCRGFLLFECAEALSGYPVGFLPVPGFSGGNGPFEVRQFVGVRHQRLGYGLSYGQCQEVFCPLVSAVRAGVSSSLEEPLGLLSYVPSLTLFSTSFRPFVPHSWDRFLLNGPHRFFGISVWVHSRCCSPSSFPSLLAVQPCCQGRRQSGPLGRRNGGPPAWWQLANTTGALTLQWVQPALTILASSYRPTAYHHS